MDKLNENIFHQYNKWKQGYERKENSIKIRLNDFLDRNPLYRDNLSISEDGKCVNCTGNIFIYDRDLINGKFPFPFGTVIDGDFSCLECKELISLEGAPEKVEGCFSCKECPKLTSLVGAPKEVDGFFSCGFCKNLKSLEGAPEKVGRWFACAGCDSLTSLEHLPKEIGTLYVDKRFKGKIPSDILARKYNIKYG